jgi:hypothetical protein
MSIDFEEGSKEDRAKGKGGWLDHTLDHLKSKVLATNLIQSAASALTQRTSVDVIMWRNAASGGPGLLRVTKGLHPHKTSGPLADLLHITMLLYDIDSKQGRVYPNTYFAIPGPSGNLNPKKFHLYTRIVNPTAPVTELQLQPVKLSYQTIAQTEIPGFDPEKDYLFTDIRSARAVTNDATARP